MPKSILPDYQSCLETLRKDSIAISAAELHGLLTGVLCAGLDTSDNWLGLLYDYTSQGTIWPSNAKAMAETLFGLTKNHLGRELMDFSLLQPKENAPLIEHAEALSDWVNGFLAGFGIAGASQIFSTETKEILEDLAQIAQLGIDEDENEAEQLELLFEVSEHVRICILSLYADNLLGIKTQSPRALH